MRVDVRRADTGEPAAGAMVAVLPVEGTHPLRAEDLLASVLGGERPSAEFVRVGPDGSAVLPGPIDAPSRLLVAAPGLLPGEVFLDSGPRSAPEAEAWILLPASGPDPIDLEVRISEQASR